MIGNELPDLIIGGSGNKIAIHQNKGRATNPVFEQDAVLWEVQKDCHGHFDVADWDGDGLNDMITGSRDGGLVWYRNNGTPKIPRFEAGASFLGLGGAYHSHPRILDFNRDGKLDMLVGRNWAHVERFSNTGTQEKPLLGDREMLRWSDGSELNTRADHGDNTTPELVDLDRDGVLDLVSGCNNGQVLFMRGIKPSESNR